jgi:uncharacterized protein (DUF58 family)
MIKFFRNIYLTNRFFYLMGAIACIFAVSFAVPVLFAVAQAGLVVALAVVLAEMFMLFNPAVSMDCRRVTPKVLSLGSENTVRIHLENKYGLTLYLSVVDELPVQLQKRDFEMRLTLLPGEERVLQYVMKPTVRGEYHFGKVNVYARSAVGFIERRFSHAEDRMVPVYPSILQMREFELKTIARIAQFHGIKKMRRLGHSYEFEQIKNYVRGDDFRSINWKATGRKSQLMVNQYEEEKAQQIYSIIDNSRNMRMPFGSLSLLDHAVNTSLVISNIALQKQDKAGLITFSDKIGTTLKADRNINQIRLILEALYKEKDGTLEANYELLYLTVRNFVKGRSLLFLYTNFESYYALERVLPILRRINRMHLLVVVFFENSEVQDFSRKGAGNVEDIYHQTVAQKFVHEKTQIVQGLRQYGIQSILTRPEDLSINTINKYLELKARGMI